MSMMAADPLPIHSLPKAKWCTIEGCHFKETHSTVAHQEIFMIHPVQRLFNDVKESAHKKLAAKPGFYTRAGVGMGYVDYYRNNSGTIENARFEYHETERIEAFTRGFKLLE
jgi:hypothetical protein